MLNGLGHPQSLLVLGGTSEIGLATAHALVAGRTRRVVLAGRDGGALERAAEGLRAKGASVDTVVFDALDVEEHDKVLGDVFRTERIDVVLLAFGVRGEQRSDEESPVEAAHVARVNYVGGVSVGLVCAQGLRRQGHGTLAVLSAVAGERVRRSDFVYGSSKAGLDAFAQGLDLMLRGTGARVMIVRPGFVHTRMTWGLVPGPLAIDAETVGRAIAIGLRTGAAVLWVPGVLRVVMSVLRHVPRRLYRLLSLGPAAFSEAE